MSKAKIWPCLLRVCHMRSTAANTPPPKANSAPSLWVCDWGALQSTPCFGASGKPGSGFRVQGLRCRGCRVWSSADMDGDTSTARKIPHHPNHSESCFKTKREHLERFSGLFPGSQGHNLALTVFSVPHSLDSGLPNQFPLSLSLPLPSPTLPFPPSLARSLALFCSRSLALSLALVLARTARLHVRQSRPDFNKTINKTIAWYAQSYSGGGGVKLISFLYLLCLTRAKIGALPS